MYLAIWEKPSYLLTIFLVPYANRQNDTLFMAQSKLISLANLSLEDLEEDADLIPLMTTDDEEVISKEPVPEIIPILPLRNTVLFPGVVIPITASRDRSIQLIKDANATNKLIGVVAQQDREVQSPGKKDLFVYW